MSGHKRTTPETFWPKLNRNGPVPKHKPELGQCWEWTGAIQKKKGGYGVTSVDKVFKYIHRLAWEYTHGPVPDGLSVLHHCDNTICGRPAHLFIGTGEDNAADRDKKLRQAFGERHWKHKLTENDIREIRAQYKFGVYGHGAYRIGKRFGISKAMILAIIHKRNWRYVK